MARLQALVAIAAWMAVGASVCSVAVDAAPVREPGRSGAIYAIGDSWSAGLYADPEHTLVQDAAEALGMASIVDAQSGTGYLTAPLGTRTYVQRAEAIPAGTRADVVVVQGGSNDDGGDLAALPGAVRRTVAAVRHAIHGAPVVLLGPGPDPWPVTAQQRAVDAALRRAAGSVGVRYVSPMQEGWFTAANVDAILDPDNDHPTPVGHEALGSRLARDLRPVLAEARAKHRSAGTSR